MRFRPRPAGPRLPPRPLSERAALRRLTHPLEKHVQKQGEQQIGWIGGHAYSLGTTRKAGDHPGTMQTEGIGDVWFFLPAPRWGRVLGNVTRACAHPAAAEWIWPDDLLPTSGWWEAKRTGETRSPEQIEVGQRCAATSTPYVWGDLDALNAWLIAGGWLKAEALPHYRQPTHIASQGES